MNILKVFRLGLFLFVIPAGARRRTVKLNTHKCKLTHSGIEYQGNVFTTKLKSLCRSWESIETETDLNFPDGTSRKSAKNYCRNPNGTREDLWCYTYNPDSPVESCDVPLCNSKRCKVTGPGVEYAGNANTTKSGYACAGWTKLTMAVNSRFPDGSRSAARNRCRNPTGDPGGPWCYVSVDGSVVPDYCDVADCDDIGGDDGCGWTLVDGDPSSAHGHYTAITFPATTDGSGDDGGGGGGSISTGGSGNDTGNVYVTFELKVWDPAGAIRDPKPFRMSLTAYPTDSGSTGDGFEVPVPANTFARRPGQVVRMELSARNGYVALSSATGRPGEILSFDLNSTLSPVTYASFISDGGSPVAVRFPYCGRTVKGCEQHVTNSPKLYRIFPLKKTIVSSSELSFSVRAVISAIVTYYIAPVKRTPCLVIVFEARPVSRIKIIYKERSTNEEQLIFHETYDVDVVSYWKWHQYTITIMDKTLQIRRVASERGSNKWSTMVDISDFKLRFFHWFSIGSQTVAQWTLYCSGPENYPVPEATLPECVMSGLGENYRGSQWISKDGESCVPWNISSVSQSVKEKDLIDGSFVKAKNFCRNPTKDPDGPYCFVAVGGDGDDQKNVTIEKRSCHVQQCRNMGCSMTGIASDYVGNLAITVSNRTCSRWKVAARRKGVRYKFPDEGSASNYCRNPNGDPTGAWCHVDGRAETDLCDVPRCDDGGGADTLLVDGGVHWMYLLPEWRNVPGLRVELKRWAPGVYAGVSLRFRRANGGGSYDLLQVGADRDEKIKLYRVRDNAGVRNETAAAAATVEEIVYPHLLMASRWTELLFEFEEDERGRTVAVAMNSAIDGQIFRWTAAVNDMGRVAFVGLSTLDGQGHTGVRFAAEDCLVHSSESRNFSVYLPINVRTNSSLTSTMTEIVFRMRHTGATRIALIKRTFDERYVLEIERDRAVLSWEGKMAKVLESYQWKAGNIISASFWTRVYLSWNESVLSLDIGHGGHERLEWTVVDRPLLIRYFSVANRGGITAWTVNCDEPWRRPPDVDGPPRDGGWSEWSDWERCTKTCGGGTGVRNRRCDNPRPNMSGKHCAGPTTVVGNCNEHECGQVSAKTVAMVRQRLAGGAHNLAATTGDKLTMSCDQQQVDAIKGDSPRAEFRWFHNGKQIRTPLASDDINCALVLNSCTTRDSGIYAFVAQPPDGYEKIVLKLIAVSVAGEQISVYIGDKVRVRCHAATLHYVFNRLSQEWIVNGSYLIKDYGTNSLASIDVDEIIVENERFQGIWNCVVKSAETNGTWVTSTMEIKGGVSN